jgi:hypothetical protein
MDTQACFGVIGGSGAFTSSYGLTALTLRNTSWRTLFDQHIIHFHFAHGHLLQSWDHHAPTAHKRIRLS